MGEKSELLDVWQDYYRHLLNAEGKMYESGASGTEYTEDELMERMRKEIGMMDEGIYPADNVRSRPVPRIEDKEGNYLLRDAIDQEWYDLISGDRYPDDVNRWIPGENSNSETFVQYYPEEKGPSPHQGWKVRVASYADEAREVGKAVIPYLKENDISHKVMQDVFAFNKNEGTRQEGKFITIYPEIDEDRQEVIMEDGAQIFKREDPSWNIFSINANTKNAREIIRDLEEELRGSVPELEGRSIDGKNGEEKQYKNTRIHFRYAHHFNTPAEVLDRQDRVFEEVEDHQGLVDKEGELVEGSYIGDQIDSAIRPDTFL